MTLDYRHSIPFVAPTVQALILIVSIEDMALAFAFMTSEDV